MLRGEKKTAPHERIAVRVSAENEKARREEKEKRDGNHALLRRVKYEGGLEILACDIQFARSRPAGKKRVVFCNISAMQSNLIYRIP